MAKFIGKDRKWLLDAIYLGAVLFAFGTTRVAGRDHVLPVWVFFTQNLFGKDLAKQIIAPEYKLLEKSKDYNKHLNKLSNSQTTVIGI